MMRHATITLLLCLLCGPAQAIWKNEASQAIELLAWDQTANTPKTGDSANLTVYIKVGSAAVTALSDTSATEVDAVNMPGVYQWDLTAAETNAEKIILYGRSSTADVTLDPVSLWPVDKITVASGVASANAVQIEGVTATTQLEAKSKEAISELLQAHAGSIYAVTSSTQITADSTTLAENTDIYSTSLLIWTSGANTGRTTALESIDFSGGFWTVVMSTGFSGMLQGDAFVLIPQTDLSLLATAASQTMIGNKIDAVDGNVDAIVAKLPSGTISDFDASTDQVALSSAAQSAVVSAVFAYVVDGTITMEEAVEKLFAYAGGKWARNSQTGVITYYLQDDVTPAMTMEIVSDVSRTVTHP